MEQLDFAILLVPLAAVIAPLLAAFFARALVIPLVVFEIALGMLIGPSGLGLVTNEPLLTGLSQFGLAILFFMAGSEINPAEIRGKTGIRAVWGWLLSAALAVTVGLIVGDTVTATVFIAIALTGTALGTITPMMRDAGLSRTPLGASISAAGAVGEFAPLIAISVLLSGNEPIVGIITLVGFAGVAGFAFWTATHGSTQWLHRMVSATLHTSGQFAIRFMILLLATLVMLAMLLGIDFLLGAFTAGMLCRVVLRDVPEHERALIDAKLESIAYGFFVPVFFVTTGITFPLATLISDPSALLLVPVFVVALLVVRGVPGYLTPLRGTGISDRRTAGLFTATSLPLVIAVTQIGVESGALDDHLAAAMVGGSMITVLCFPMLALLGRSPRKAARPTSDTQPATAHVDDGQSTHH